MCSRETGMGDSPHIPPMMVVTPCSRAWRQVRSRSSMRSWWLWASMKPGARVSPPPSSTSFAPVSVRPMAAILPPETATRA